MFNGRRYVHHHVLLALDDDNHIANIKVKEYLEDSLDQSYIGRKDFFYRYRLNVATGTLTVSRYAVPQSFSELTMI